MNEKDKGGAKHGKRYKDPTDEKEYPTGGGNRYKRVVKSSLVSLALGAVLLWPKPLVLAENVGDKMPEPKGTLMREIPISDYDAKMDLYVNDNGVYQQTRVHKICDGVAETNPYGVYDFKEKTVYIDADRDGIIDRKDQGADIRRPVDDLPECK